MAPTRPGGTGKRGRPKKSAVQVSKQMKNRGRGQAVTKQKKGRNPSSQTQNNATSSHAAPSPRSEPRRGRRRKAQDTDIDEIATAEEASTTRKYEHLKPRTKRIPHAVIETWPTISQPVHEQINIILRRAKDAVVLSRRDHQKTAEAAETLNSFVRKLERHFSTTRIPPQAKARDFDLDLMIERKNRAFQEVTSTRHRKQLLEEQIEISTAKFKTEERLTRELKENAQRWRREWKSQEKNKLHPLLQQSEDSAMVEDRSDDRPDDRPEDIGLRKWAPADTAMLDAPDSELAPLLEQLRRNLETMQGNHAQVEGIDEAVRDAQVALDDMVFNHASATQYDAL